MILKTDTAYIAQSIRVFHRIIEAAAMYVVKTKLPLAFPAFLHRIRIFFYGITF